jgi:predicted Zn-dependent protease
MKQGLFFFLAALSLFACRQQTKPSSQDTRTIETQDEVLQNLKEAISQNPDSVKLYDRLIDTLANRKQYSEAASWCNKLIVRGADSNYYYWFIKGDIFRHGQMYDSAINCYQTYLRKFPDDEQVLLNLANTYAEAGNKDAVDLANMVVAKYPTREMRSEAAFIKGVYYNTIKEYSNARRWLDTAIVINYNFIEAYMEKGYSLYDEKKYSEAYKTFSRIPDLNSNYADAWYWMAKCQEAMGNNKEALADYKEAFSLDNSISEAKNSIDRLGKQVKP